MDKYTVTLSLLLVASILFNIFFFVIQNRFEIFKSLIPEISSLKSLLSNSTTNLDIIFREDLTNKTQSHSFSVLYECNVVETTEKKLKLNAFDFKSNDDWANNNKQSVIAYLQPFLFQIL